MMAIVVTDNMNIRHSDKYECKTTFEVCLQFESQKQFEVVLASETIRSRRHVQAEGYPPNLKTIGLRPEIHCVASQQVKNLSEKDQV